jgi:hypothetical protein
LLSFGWDMVGFPTEWAFFLSFGIEFDNLKGVVVPDESTSFIRQIFAQEKIVDKMCEHELPAC